MKRDFQDKLFHICKNYPEFRQYATEFKDLEKFEDGEIIKDDLKRLWMDSLFISPSQNILVNIEHQTSISNPIMFRNLEYQINASIKYSKIVYQCIFHTGLRNAPKKFDFNMGQTKHTPYLKQTYEYDGVETFKKIKNKLKNNKETSSQDVFDLLWLPRFRNIQINDEFLKEYIDVISHFKKK